MSVLACTLVALRPGGAPQRARIARAADAERGAMITKRVNAIPTLKPWALAVLALLLAAVAVARSRGLVR